ncbi:MAG: hypothetical protein ACLUW6_05735 [Coriobacteriaceae bacterium]
MADLTEDLAGLTDAIVRPLIDEPDALDITAAETEDGNIMVEIAWPPTMPARSSAVRAGSSNRTWPAPPRRSRASWSMWSSSTKCAAGCHRLSGDRRI